MSRRHWVLLGIAFVVVSVSLLAIFPPNLAESAAVPNEDAAAPPQPVLVSSETPKRILFVKSHKTGGSTVGGLIRSVAEARGLAVFQPKRYKVTPDYVVATNWSHTTVVANHLTASSWQLVCSAYAAGGMDIANVSLASSSSGVGGVAAGAAEDDDADDQAQDQHESSAMQDSFWGLSDLVGDEDDDGQPPSATHVRRHRGRSYDFLWPPTLDAADAAAPPVPSDGIALRERCPEWFKVTIVRHPVSQVLSAFKHARTRRNAFCSRALAGIPYGAAATRVALFWLSRCRPFHNVLVTHDLFSERIGVGQDPRNLRFYDLVMVNERMVESVVLLLWHIGRGQVDWEHALYKSSKVSEVLAGEMHVPLSAIDVNEQRFASIGGRVLLLDWEVWKSASRLLDEQISSLPVPREEFDRRVRFLRDMLAEFESACDSPADAQDCYWHDNGCALQCRAEFSARHNLTGVLVWP